MNLGVILFPQVAAVSSQHRDLALTIIDFSSKDLHLDWDVPPFT